MRHINWYEFGLKRAHPQFEHQSKYKIHDRWAQREAGAVPGPSLPRVKVEAEVMQEERASRMEQRMRAARAPQVQVKSERFGDDYRREGRQLERVRRLSTNTLMLRAWKVASMRSSILTRMSTFRMTRRITLSTVTRRKRKMQSCKR